ncbi:MAG: SAM-dependent chlorinase/fluorinase [Spirochaetota bacterium]|nr:MAG: SAM-dependent chlorinase/fluorinase [Spirochaetota bacterium]
MKKMLTFSSDFGYKDTYVAEVKGVIEACCKDVHIIDLTHGIEQGNLAAASFVLLSASKYFPKGTVHLAVIDPGVGTTRKIIVVNTGQYTFIGPDNGILYEPADSDGIKNIWEVDIERFLKKMPEAFPKSDVIKKILKQGVSSTFHGRDLFAPLSGYVLNGFSMGDIANTARSMVKIEISKPAVSGDKIFGKVIYIDRFGNLITNIPNEIVRHDGEVFLKTGRKMISIGVLNSGAMSGTYANVSRGKPVPLTGSRGYVEIAVNCGSAAEYFGAVYDDEILVLKR